MCAVMPASTKITPATKRELRSLGRKLKRARLVRRLPMELIAERGGISIPTLRRIEGGEPNVRIASYLLVMQALGLLKEFANFTDPLDTELTDEQLPQRGRRT